MVGRGGEFACVRVFFVSFFLRAGGLEAAVADILFDASAFVKPPPLTWFDLARAGGTGGVVRSIER